MKLNEVVDYCTGKTARDGMFERHERTQTAIKQLMIGDIMDALKRNNISVPISLVTELLEILYERY